MSALRLLWLTDSLTAGGAEALAVTYARAHDPARVDLRVAFLKSLDGNRFEAELRDLGVPVHDLQARNLRDVAAFRRLLRLLRAHDVELVHAHLAYASTWGAAAGALTRLPVVTSFHVAPPPDPPWSREGMRRRLRVRLVNAFAARAVAVSRAVAEAWAGAGLDPAKTEVIHNGVPLGSDAGEERPAVRERLRRELGVGAGTPLLLTVSVLRRGKGLGDLLAAVERLAAGGRDAVLAVAGDGPLRGELESWVRSRGLGDRVRLLGFRDDVPDLLAAADLFVLASTWDAFPTAVLEAMAAGLPVVATWAGGIPEMVEEGETGLLVEPAAPADLAVAVGRLLDRPELARRLGRAGRQRVEERFSVNAWCGRLDALYRRCAAGRKEVAA